MYAVTSVKFIGDTVNLFAGNVNGDVIVLNIAKHDKSNFRVNINKIIENVGFAVHNIDISKKEKYDVWLLTTKNGKIMVWNRKTFKKSVEAPNELNKIYELEYYLTDNFKISKSLDSINLNKSPN